MYLKEKFKNKFKEKNPLLYMACRLIIFCIMIQCAGFVLHGDIVTINTLCNTNFGQAFLYGTFLNKCAAILLFLVVPVLIAILKTLSDIKNNHVLRVLSMGLTILFSIICSFSVSMAVVEVFGTVCGWIGLADIKSGTMLSIKVATMFGRKANLISATCLCCVFQSVNIIKRNHDAQ